MNSKLNTNLAALFVTDVELQPIDQAKLDSLNQQLAEVTEILQPIFRRLIIEMLDLKQRGGGNA